MERGTMTLFHLRGYSWKKLAILAELLCTKETNTPGTCTASSFSPSEGSRLQAQFSGEYCRRNEYHRGSQGPNTLWTVCVTGTMAGEEWKWGISK